VKPGRADLSEIFENEFSGGSITRIPGEEHKGEEMLVMGKNCQPIF
jgi:hypothetical protein